MIVGIFSAEQAQAELGWLLVKKQPSFLNKYKWRPKYLYYDRKLKKYVGVDVIYNEQISTKIYEKEAKKAITENDNFEVCLFTHYEYTHDHLSAFCRVNGFGLKVYGSGIIGTVIPLSFEKAIKVKRKRHKKYDSWFPKVIIDQVKNIKKLKYTQTIIQLANDLDSTADLPPKNCASYN